MRVIDILHYTHLYLTNYGKGATANAWDLFSKQEEEDSMPLFSGKPDKQDYTLTEQEVDRFFVTYHELIRKIETLYIDPDDVHRTAKAWLKDIEFYQQHAVKSLKASKKLNQLHYSFSKLLLWDGTKKPVAPKDDDFFRYGNPPAEPNPIVKVPERVRSAAKRRFHLLVEQMVTK